MDAFELEVGTAMGHRMSGVYSTIRQPSRVLHPEVVGDRFEGANDAEGRPLVHAERTSKPIRARTPASAGVADLRGCWINAALQRVRPFAVSGRGIYLCPIGESLDKNSNSSSPS
jgi:hypothetical protein